MDMGVNVVSVVLFMVGNLMKEKSFVAFPKDGQTLYQPYLH